eukprot:3619166-Amphidinium_carterae.1
MTHVTLHPGTGHRREPHPYGGQCWCQPGCVCGVSRATLHELMAVDAPSHWTLGSFCSVQDPAHTAP